MSDNNDNDMVNLREWAFKHCEYVGPINGSHQFKALYPVNFLSGQYCRLPWLPKYIASCEGVVCTIKKLDRSIFPEGLFIKEGDSFVRANEQKVNEAGMRNLLYVKPIDYDQITCIELGVVFSREDKFGKKQGLNLVFKFPVWFNSKNSSKLWPDDNFDRQNEILNKENHIEQNKPDVNKAGLEQKNDTIVSGSEKQINDKDSSAANLNESEDKNSQTRLNVENQSGYEKAQIKQNNSSGNNSNHVNIHSTDINDNVPKSDVLFNLNDEAKEELSSQKNSSSRNNDAQFKNESLKLNEEPKEEFRRQETKSYDRSSDAQFKNESFKLNDEPKEEFRRQETKSYDRSNDAQFKNESFKLNEEPKEEFRRQETKSYDRSNDAQFKNESFKLNDEPKKESFVNDVKQADHPSLSSGNYTRRLPVYLLIDTSGSMNGEPIQAVQIGIKSMVDEMCSDPYALDSVSLSVITFDRDAKVLFGLTPIYEVDISKINASDDGPTHMGYALQVLKDRMASEVRKTSSHMKGDFIPIVFLMTDGKPSDTQMYMEMCSWFKQNFHGRIIACAAGPNAKAEPLKNLTDSVYSLNNLNREMFKKFFVWVSAAVSQCGKSQGINANVKDVVLPPPPDEINIII